MSTPCFDVNSACSTFAVQLRVLSMMSPDSLPDFILLVQPENLTRTVNYSDRRTAVLMGDCTTAAILSHRIPSAVRIARTTMASDPSAWRKVTIPGMGHLQQEGGAVQNFAIRKMAALIEDIGGEHKPDFWFVGHQANLPMLQSVCARAGIDGSKHLYNVDQRGNCGAAGAPAVISERFESFQPGDEVLVATVGAGLTWAGFLMQFGAEACQ